MKNIYVGDKQVNEILVFDGLRNRRVIGKIMTSEGLKRFYTPIDIKTDFVVDENMKLQSSSTRLEKEVVKPPTELYFDGVDDYIVIPNTNNRLQPNQQFCWEMWFKLESYTQYNTLMGFSSNNLDFGRMDSTTNFRSHTWNTLNQQPFIDPSGFPPVDDGNWHHMAIVWDGVNGQRWAFIDGVQRHYGTMAKGDQIASSEPFPTFTIGGAVPGGRLINGWIKEVRMWQKARTQDEIINSMNVRLNGNEDGLLLYLPLDEGNGDKLKDLASGFDAQIYSASWQGGGEINIEVSNSIGFNVGDEITLSDGINYEDVIITKLTVDVITVNKISRSYKKNSILMRSNSKISNSLQFNEFTRYNISG